MRRMPIELGAENTVFLPHEFQLSAQCVSYAGFGGCGKVVAGIR